MKTSSRWIVLILTVVTRLPGLTSAQGHFENYDYTVTSLQNRCNPYSYQSCSSSFWGFFESCQTITEQRCGLVTVTETRTDRRCQAGWSPPGVCTQAICSPQCSAGQTCTSPNNCVCLTSSYGACATVACSNDLDCYPGTCNSASNGCLCPSGFSGPNCQTILVKPVITGCSAKVYANPTSEYVIAQSDCSAESIDPVPAWISTSSPTRIEVIWNSQVTTSSVLPRVNYINNSPAPIGVAQAKFTIDFLTQTGVSSLSYTSPCVTNWVNPAAYQPCDVNVQWTNIGIGQLTHNQTFNVIPSSQSGGQKTGTAGQLGGNFNIRPLTGLSGIGRIQFRVDLVRPSHCLIRTNNAAQCPCFPIVLDQDIRTNPVIQPQACGWTDDGAGIWYVRYELFYMQPNGNGLLADTGSALTSLDDYNFQLNSFRYTVQTPGVYSIKMTVFDHANNYAIARKLFVYTGNSRMTVNNQMPYLREAAASTGYKWITDLPVPRDTDYYQLTVVWTGRYQSDARFNDAWLKAAVQYPYCTAGSDICVDDVYRTNYGFRSVDAIQNATGILGYMLSFTVDSQGGLGITNPPPYNFTPPTQSQQTIYIQKDRLHDGDTILVWLSVTDAAGNSDLVKFQVGLDRTPPFDTSISNFKMKTVDQFTSSFTVTVNDRESGIKAVTYSIYDVTLKIPVWSDTVDATTMPIASTNSSRKKRDAAKLCPPQGDATCYCIPTGVCYPINQTINVDNCKFDRYTANPLRITYTVTNQAGLNTTGTIELGVLTDIECRPSPPSTSPLGPGATAGIVIGVLVPTILLLVLIGMMCWRWRTKKDPLPASVRGAYNRTVRRLNIRKESRNEVYASPPEVIAYPVAFEKNQSADVVKLGRTPEVPGLPGLAYSAKQVHTNRMLAKGRFAVVSSGTLTKQNEMVPVAVKALLRDFTEVDRDVMTKKVTFMAGLKSHINIVRFLGSYNSEDQGPVMLLELCEVPLKDWLGQLNEISSEIIEEMFTFVLHIARGVEHLHANKVVHRRLRVGNVLLKKQSDGSYTAKLIGFGPSKDDSSSPGDDDNIMPLRWLAPETHNTIHETYPTYNNQTDAWSYGITVWEIYSKGTKPYRRFAAKDVGKMIQQGERMERPDYCPPQIFQDVVMKCWDRTMRKRPSFNAIVKSLNKFQRGADGSHADYYAAGSSNRACDDYYAPGPSITNNHLYDDIANM